MSAKSDACNDILNIAFEQIGVIYQQKKSNTNEPNMDPDCLYQDFCTGNSVDIIELVIIVVGNGTLLFAEDQGYPSACNPIGDRLTTYLNRPDVQQAIGVPPTNWQSCVALNYTFDDAGSMVPYYQSFFQQRPDLSILIYSGDVDIGTVPFGFTQACIAEFGDSPISSLSRDVKVVHPFDFRKKIKRMNNLYIT